MDAHLRRIRVLIADDSAFMRTALVRMIQSDPDLEVVGTAQDGMEALEKVTRFKPDVLTLDIEMPRLNGLQTLQRLMAENPLPVIMISSLTQEGAEATLQAFDLGAFDCITKQLSYASLDIIKIRDQLIAKIKAGAHAKVARPARPRTTQAEAVPAAHPPWAHVGPPPGVVAIGTSTGGPKALQEVLPLLPADFPVGILVVQHMPPGFTGPFAKRLDALSKISVHEAGNEEAIEPGVALIAPAGWQMTVFRRTHTKYAVRLAKTPTDTQHIPSVDVMMLSVAEIYGALAMGVIMTGMGNDGEQGMRAIQAKGGLTLGQDEASCVVYGMPRACAEAGILSRVAPLERIPAELVLATSNSACSTVHRT